MPDEWEKLNQSLEYRRDSTGIFIDVRWNEASKHLALDKEYDVTLSRDDLVKLRKAFHG